MGEVISSKDMASYSFDVFLSYARQDISFVRDLVKWLRQSGYKVWIDEEQLVPGSLFCAGIQQGLRESRHIVAILTPEYVNRHWTRREIDLFDLDADHSERRILAIQIGDLPAGPLDQAFIVHQRIRWSGSVFDPEAFWNLNCGLAYRRPGPREEWSANGLRLLEASHSSSYAPDMGRRFALTALQDATYADMGTKLTGLAKQVLDAESLSWKESFGELCHEVSQRSRESAFRYFIEAPWSTGHAEVAALFSLAMLADKRVSWREYEPWPFIDLSSFAIAGWFLAQGSLAGRDHSEVWFTWAASQKCWDLMLGAAAKAPSDLADHFEYLALSVSSRDRSFAEVEAEYDYGRMITPWNHFNLSWVADCLGDFDACISHLRVLCATGAHGDSRTGRFINRFATWPMFSEYRRSGELRQQLVMARERLVRQPHFVP